MSDPQGSLILLVEDEPDILLTTELLLKNAGYEVLVASHPAMALDLLEEARPRVIITDYMMPWMDGRAFTEQLKTNPGTREIPVILVSAVTTGPGPWDASLRKPVEYDQLFGTIERLLRRA